MATCIAAGSSAPNYESDTMFELKALKFGFEFSHRSFHWPIFPVNLRLFEYIIVNSNSSLIYDGFDPTLFELNLPVNIKIKNDLDNCFVHYEVRARSLNCSDPMAYLDL